MQRKWRRAWLRGKSYFMSYRPVREIRTRNIKSKVYSVANKVAKKLVPVAAAAGVFLSTLTGVQANPSGGTVASGTGSITGQGTNSVTINQTSDKLGINWQSFSINSGEKVQFIQPGASSIALNRVLGNNASAIYGQLSANGQVFLINPNGVLFAKGAQVNVGGLVASTLNLSDKDFINGKYTFSGDSQKSVLNQGNITTANGGYVALLGATVANEGVIVAQQGKVAMGAGSKVTLDFAGDGLLTLSVDESAINAEAKNSGLMKADGGLVVMNAKAADSLTGSVVNNSGTIEAKSVTNKNGTIILEGSTAKSSGTLDASGKGAGETGGTIKVLGDTVALASGSKLDVSGDKGGGTALVGGAYQGGSSEYAATKTTVQQGTSINADAITSGNGGQVVVWANDTTKFAGSISAKGGKVSGDGGSVETSGHKTLTVADTARVNTTAAQGKTGNWLLDPADFVVDDTGTKGMTAAALSSALQSSSVTITTNSDTTSATAVKISDSTTIGTNADTSGTGDITINSAVSWDSANTTLTLTAYNNININANITASGVSSGLAMSSSNGTYTLSGGRITLSGSGATFALKKNSDAVYTNYTVINSHSTGGALTALQNINSSLDNSYFLGEDIDASATSAWNGNAGFVPIGNNTNKFTGTFDGGGHTISGLTINSSANCVGLFGYTALNSQISNVGLVGGSVIGRNNVGGLVGYSRGVITNSYATGSVNGNLFVGGLAGTSEGTITNSYATGSVNGNEYVGGLVGDNEAGTITNSYATGSVNGNEYVGGLVGVNFSTITNSYATGSVTSTGTDVGGVVGHNYGSATVTNSYWDVDTTGKNAGFGTNDNTTATSFDATGLHSSTGTAFSQANYNGFDFANTWGFIEGTSYPYLKWRYTDTPQVVSGIVSGATVSGQTVQVAANGNLISSTTTGANGFYYFLFNNQTIADNAALLTYIDNSTGSVKANAVTRVNGANASNTGLALTSGVVNVYGNNSSATLDVNTLMTSAKGSLTDTDLLYTANSGIISVTGGLSVFALSSALTVTNVMSASGDVLLKAKDDLTLAAAGSVTSTGGNVTLVSTDGQFINSNTAADALKGSHWMVYSATPNIAQRGNLNYSFSQYGKTYGDSIALADSGNGFIYSGALNLSAKLTGKLNKIYDGKTDAALTTDNVSITGIADAIYSYTLGDGSHYDNKNAGENKIVTAGTITLGSVTDNNAKSVYGYSFDGINVSGNGSISKRQLTATATAQDKVYDGTTSATIGSVTLGNVLANENLTASYTGGVFDDKNVGNNKAVTLTGLSMTAGTDTLTDNYQLPVGSANASITKANLTITANANTKTYDGTTSASALPSYTGLQSGDTLTDLVEAYNDKNAGSSKTLSVSSYILNDGNSCGNYTVTTVNNTSGIINKASLTITAAANSKSYDGTTSATVLPSYTSLQSGDTLTNIVEAYTDKNTGSGKTLSVTSYTLNDGNNGDNYTVTKVDTTGNIDKAGLTVTANDAANIYDKTAYIGGNGITYTGLVNGEKENVLIGSLTYSGTSQGATEVGSYKITPGGLTAVNYTITFKDGTLTIKPAAITDPGYIAAVQNTQQTAGDHPQQAGNNSAAYPLTTNGASQQAADSQVSPVQYRRDNTQTPRVITASGQTVTVVQASPVQLNTNVIQQDIQVYQMTNGSTSLAAAYHVDGSQGALSLTKTVMAAPTLPQAPQAAPLSQTDTASFQLTDAEGRTADFTIAYIGNSLHVKALNGAAAEMLTQNQQQLVTATALVTAQDKLSVEMKDLKTVYLDQ